MNPSRRYKIINSRLQMLQEKGVRPPQRWEFLPPTSLEVSFKNPRDLKVLELLSAGMSRENISVQLDLPPWYIHTLVESKRGKQLMEQLQPKFNKTLQQRIQEFAPEAEQLLEDIITGKLEGASLALRAKYASLALARAGHGPVTKVQSVHAQLTREDIEALKARALEASKDLTQGEEITLSPSEYSQTSVGEAKPLDQLVKRKP